MGKIYICTVIADAKVKNLCEIAAQKAYADFKKTPGKDPDVDKLWQEYQVIRERYFVQVHSAGSKRMTVHGKVVDQECAQEWRGPRSRKARHLVALYDREPIDCRGGNGCRAVEGAMLLAATLSERSGEYTLDFRTDLESAYIMTDNPFCDGSTYTGKGVPVLDGQKSEILLTIIPVKF